MRLKMTEEMCGKMHEPIMLAGWPGMGNVGINAIQYIRADLGAKEFAQIDMTDELMPPSVHVKDGLVMRDEFPMTRFYCIEASDVIFVESPAQIEGAAAVSVMRGLIDLAHELSVSTIYTAASFAVPVGCDHPVEIYGAANDVVLRDRLGPMGVSILEEGSIAGMNGVLLGYTNGYQIPAACLMATMPQYATNLPNPKSSQALIRLFEKIAGFHVDMTGLDQEVKRMTEVMKQVEQRIQQVVSHLPEESKSAVPGQEISVDTEKKTPDKAIQRIERMFQELAKNRSKAKAARLKKELDRWELYDLYEDRFLGLFKNEEDEQ